VFSGVSVFPAVDRAKRPIAVWLLACCALVFAMIVVGGITRLTHSGLSIVEWQPIVGALPPLDAAQWQEAFAKYRRTPEFRLRNFDMTLEGFKGIFWWEYVHRLLGRVIGLAFLLPFLYFLLRRRIDRALGAKLAAIFVLGGMQGALGWYMVASGLVDDPRVSQFRLAAHLAMAFVIYGAMLWVALDLLRARGAQGPAALRRLGASVVALVLLMVVTGALVAGIRAGYAYNTFPLMNGHVVPPEIFMIDPWWKNFGYNMATVQFDHRALAWVLLTAVIATWVAAGRAAPSRPARAWSHALLLALCVQFALGIATLLSTVNLALAACHQAGSVLVYTCAIGLHRAVSR
jgi:cytochrome c oxidase assembly protein subunit 15